MSGYLGDVAALARKDLRLELRARDTLPAMLLFVLATLVVFHFALPAGAAEDAAYGLLWVSIVFTALLGLAWGTIFIWRRSVLAPSISHAGFNAAQVLQFVVFGG